LSPGAVAAANASAATQSTSMAGNDIYAAQMTKTNQQFLQQFSSFQPTSAFLGTDRSFERHF
jgi:hypothetical protein